MESQSSSPPYVACSVSSADGTRVAYRKLGAGPGIVLLHGGMMASHNLMKLGGALSSDFTVYIPDRRGRASSGPFGDRYGLEREREDLGAILEATGATSVFGLSSGAIVCLAGALTLPIRKLAIYEPPLLIPGASHLGWLPRYEREIAQGQLASAMVTILKGTGDASPLTLLPRPLLVPLFHLAIAAEAKEIDVGQVRLPDLIATMRFDAKLVTETEHALDSFGAVQAKVLLIGGSKSAPYLRRALDALGSVVPKAKRVELLGVGHLAADNGGRPERVAAALRPFFQDAASFDR